MNRFSVPLAFITVLVIWSTTPLAIKWSSGEFPMASVLLRMLLGICFCSLLLVARRKNLPLGRDHLKVYLVGGLSIFFGMSLIYWALQSIPSGWVAVLFGLSPLFTGLFAAIVEPETHLGPRRIAGLMLGLLGLFLVFQAGLSVDQHTLNGVLLIILSVISASSSAVAIRHLSGSIDLSGMQTTTGSLVIAIPLFLLVALIIEPVAEIQFTRGELWAIAYLGLIGTGVGFTLYYFLLRHISASRVALITLVTPVTALLLGSWLNDEAVVANVWLGALCVCSGLILYEYRPRIGWRKL